MRNNWGNETRAIASSQNPNPSVPNANTHPNQRSSSKTHNNAQGTKNNPTPESRPSNNTASAVFAMPARHINNFPARTSRRPAQGTSAKSGVVIQSSNTRESQCPKHHQTYSG